MRLNSNASSFWLRKVSPYRHSLHHNHKCDIAIVGGGITGMAAAHRLSESGLSVSVFEKYGIGEGSTGMSGGFLAAATSWDLRQLFKMVGREKGATIYRSVVDAIRSLEETVSSEHIKCDFRRVGALYFATERSHRMRLEEEYKELTKLGYQAELYEKGDSRIPIAGAHGALKTFLDAECNPAFLVFGLMDLVLRRGSSIFTDTEITRIHEENGGVQLLTSAGHTIYAAKVIIATNGWIELLHAMPHLRTISVPYVSHIAVTEPVPGIRDRWRGELLWNTYEIYHYLRLLDDDRVMIGGESRWLGWPHHGEFPGVSGYNHKLIGTLHKYFPSFTFRLAQGWSGYLAIPIDGFPVIETRGNIHAAIVDGIPMGWLAGNVLADRVINATSSFGAIYDAHRDFGFWRNMYVKLPLPKFVKNLVLAVGLITIRLLDEIDKLVRY